MKIMMRKRISSTNEYNYNLIERPMQSGGVEYNIQETNKNTTISQNRTEFI